MAIDSRMVSSTPTAKNMNSRVFSDSTKKQKKKISKLLLDGFDGFQTKWPPISQTTDLQICKLLIRTFEELNFKILTTKEKKILEKREKNSESTKSFDEIEKNSKTTKVFDEIVARQKSVSALKNQLVFGINEVTRGLEKDQFSLVVVDRSTQPFSMISHIPLLAASRNTPAVAIEGLSTTLASKIGVGSLVAFAFKSLSPAFSTLVTEISRLIQPIQSKEKPVSAKDSIAIETGISNVQEEKFPVSDGMTSVPAETEASQFLTVVEKDEIAAGTYKSLVIKRLSKDEERAAKLNSRQKKPAPVFPSETKASFPGKRKAKMVKIGKRRRDNKPVN